MKASSIVFVLLVLLGLLNLFVASHGAAVPPSSPAVVSYSPTSKGSSNVTHTTFPATTVEQTGALAVYETAKWTNESSAQEEGSVNSLRAESLEGGLLPATSAEVAANTAEVGSSDVLPAFVSSGGGAASTDFGGSFDGNALAVVDAPQTVDYRSLTETTIDIANIATSVTGAGGGDKLVLNTGTYSTALLTLGKSITITCSDITTAGSCTLDGNNPTTTAASGHQVLKLSATTTDTVVNVEYLKIEKGFVSNFLCCTKKPTQTNQQEKVTTETPVMRCLQNCLH
jgi:hypothetical protein